ncbi:glycosyltransferase [Candidatus Poribacteria bacterium]|nr:glycosyltransferase [Candidatus Poribacteria bacterium]
MKILFPYMARWRAVNWTRYHSLLNCLAAMGHSIYVLQPPPLRSAESNFREIDVEAREGITLIDVPVPDWIWKRRLPLEKLFKKGIYSLLSLRRAREIIRREGIDVMILYNIPQYPYLFLGGPKKVFDFADDYLSMLQHELGWFSNRFVLRVAEGILEGMISRSDRVFAVSNVLTKAMNGRAVVLPNGVAREKADYARTNPIMLDLPPPIIGFIGSFEYFIDFEIILGAAEVLSGASFLLVGTGREWENVRREALRRGLDNVHMPGGVTHRDVFRYIDRMDVCLNIFRKIPVADGACPIKLFEYLIMGKPVVTTRLKELEYIDDGFLFYGDDIGEVCRSVHQILHPTPEVSSKIRRGNERALHDYTWERIADRFLRHVS